MVVSFLLSIALAVIFGYFWGSKAQNYSSAIWLSFVSGIVAVTILFIAGFGQVPHLTWWAIPCFALCGATLAGKFSQLSR